MESGKLFEIGIPGEFLGSRDYHTNLNAWFSLVQLGLQEEWGKREIIGTFSYRYKMLKNNSKLYLFFCT